jgi:hypothetical protein
MIKMEYCLNDNEYLIHINDIVKGSSSPYKCICHQEKVIAKKGDIVQHHFAHAASTDNEYLYFENLVKIKETLLHKKAKEIIKSWKEIKVKPETKFNHNEFVYLKLINNDDLEIKNDLYGKSYIFNIIDVKIEKKIQNVSIIPDITLICSFGEKIFNLHIEIEVFHKVGDEKFQILKENKINCLEIKITDLYNLNTLKITDEYFDTNAFLKIIEEALLNIQNHRWLYFDENIVYCEEEVKERNEKIKNIFRQKNFELLEERKRRMENYFSPEIWESKWQKYFYLFISREEEEENFQNVAKHCFLASNQFFKFMCAGLLFECSKISGTRYEIRNNDKNIYLNLEYDQSLVAEKSFMLNDLNKEVNSSKYYLFSVHVSNKVYSYIKKQIVDFENISKLKHCKQKPLSEMSNAEIKQVAERLRLEKEYSRLTKAEKSFGKRYVENFAYAAAPFAITSATSVGLKKLTPLLKAKGFDANQVTQIANALPKIGAAVSFAVKIANDTRNQNSSSQGRVDKDD